MNKNIEDLISEMKKQTIILTLEYSIYDFTEIWMLKLYNLFLEIKGAELEKEIQKLKNQVDMS